MSGKAGSDARRGDGTGRLWLVAGLGVALSIGAIPYALCCGVADDGGRGGALAVALTFAMFFLDRRTAGDYLERALPSDRAAGEISAQDGALKAYVAGLATRQTQTRNALAAMLDWDKRQKLPLALCSITGTLFWGFGDLVAASLGAPP